jgi:hypothetical protein
VYHCIVDDFRLFFTDYFVTMPTTSNAAGVTHRLVGHDYLYLGYGWTASNPYSNFELAESLVQDSAG